METRCESGRARSCGAVAAIAVFSWILCFGCAGAPLPLVARAGTTVGIPLSGEVAASGAGEGVAYGAINYPDPQRGYLWFYLQKVNTPSVWFYVNTRAVVRVVPDPASPAGLTGEFTVQGPTGPLDLPALQQVLAVVDIPSDVSPGTYWIKSERYEDAAGSVYHDEGPTDSKLQKIEIIAPNGDQDFTPFQGNWPGWFGDPKPDVTSQIGRLIPYPKLVVALPSPAPAAATMDLTYNPAEVEIQTVLTNDRIGQGAFLTHELIPPNTVRIHYANPSADSAELALVFSLTTSAAFNPVVATDFSFVSGAFYDADGSPIAPPAGYQPIGEIR